MSQNLPAKNLSLLQPVITLPSWGFKPLAMAVSSVLLAACSSAPTQTVGRAGITPTTTRVIRTVPVTPSFGRHSTATVQANAGLLDDDSLNELEGLLEATDMTMVENNSLLVQKYGNLWDRLRASFKMDSNRFDPRIEAQKSWFVSRQDYLNRLTARASRYLYHTVREAERRNIPTELALLPVIESSYDPLANSNAAAVGLWQFIPSTGRIYGLNQSSTFDGRRDVIESTRAAYDFLTTLYNQFGSWELALAAYNAGPGRIQSAIDYNAARGLPTDYWSLRLPTETMNYVPRFLAVAQIVKNPNAYGVYLPAIANRQHFRSVPANVGVSLNDVSNVTGVGYDELRALNPGLLAGMVDSAAPNRVLIPNELSSTVDTKISKLRGNGYSSYPAYNASSTSYPAVTTNSYNTSGFNSSATNSPRTGDTLAAAQQAYQAPSFSSNASFTTPTGKLPTSSSDLANFANTMVKNQTTAYVAPIKTSEPPLTIVEQKHVTQQMKAENTLPTTFAQVTPNNTIVQEPPLSPKERDQIAQQIEQTTPQVSQVVSPVDGNIKITAIQTQQSVLAAKGETKQLSYDSLEPPAPTLTKPITTPADSGLPSNNFSPDGGMGTPTVPAVTTPATPASNVQPAMSEVKAIVKKPRPIGTRSTYQVKKGDTLASIGSHMGVNWQDIADWNQIDPNANLLYGTTLYLYNAKPIAEPATVKPLPKTIVKKPENTQTYIVQPGDTLGGIANKFDLDLSELASYNNLPTNYAVKTKQTLWLIPNKVKTAKPISKPAVKVPPIATTNYKVQAGDGLIALADDYDISPSQLAALNGLDADDSLEVGQILKVPATAQASAKTPIKVPVTKVNNPKIVARGTTYVVQSGDTLSSIADDNDISVSQLAKANGMTTASGVQLNQKIIVPNNNTQASIVKTPTKTKVMVKPSAKASPKCSSYKVKNGDSLSSLAKRYDMTPKELADANGIPSNTSLKIGQTIQLPEE